MSLIILIKQKNLITGRIRKYIWLVSFTYILYFVEMIVLFVVHTENP